METAAETSNRSKTSVSEVKNVCGSVVTGDTVPVSCIIERSVKDCCSPVSAAGLVHGAQRGQRDATCKISKCRNNMEVQDGFWLSASSSLAESNTRQSALVTGIKNTCEDEKVMIDGNFKNVKLVHRSN